MNETDLKTHGSGHILATDLDGTLIPLDGDARNAADLETLTKELAQNEVELVYVTGRHLESVLHTARQQQLPLPQWIICDVGTSIYRGEEADSWRFSAVAAYQDHLRDLVAKMPIEQLRADLQSIVGLRLQEEEKQGLFKLSYYAEANQLEALVDEIQRYVSQAAVPYSVIHSIDPFNGDGLIDLLPHAVSKAYALAWWTEHTGVMPEGIVFAGDSGNDLAALTAGYRAIVVGNANHAVARKAYDAHREVGWRNRLYLATESASSGLLEGCQWFGLINHADPPDEISNRLGATPVRHDQTHFRVWAPDRRQVAVEIDGGEGVTRHRLDRQADGYFSRRLSGIGPGSRYRYVLDDQVARPDPVSRFQPEGVHGPSQVVNPAAFPWTDSAWPGIPTRDLIIYELHVGTFTETGTYQAAVGRLSELVDLGVTAVELMPVAQTPGRWNWGYDGVNLFAPRNTYGEPEDLKALVDACHHHGLAVILDVVYNHIGPEGNYLADFGPYFSKKHHAPWGEAFDFEAAGSHPVREHVIHNAIFWLDEYRFDGLRLDAASFIADDSQPHILDELRRAVTNLEAASNRKLHLIAETNVYDGNRLSPSGTAAGYDAIWCDCLMLSLYAHGAPHLRLTDREYGQANDLIEVLQYGYLYEGVEPRRVERRADSRPPTDRSTPPAHLSAFVTALQTHDGVGNHPGGLRIHHVLSKDYQKAAAALTLLFPSIPLLFMGEEHACACPFPFFTDFEDEQLRRAVDEGRNREYPVNDHGKSELPSHPDTFYKARCGGCCAADEDMRDWYRKLIALRKRGLRQGWLHPQNLRVSNIPEDDLFSVRYVVDEAAQLEVHARLTRPSDASPAPCKLSLAGPVSLSSSRVSRINNQVLLPPNVAIILQAESVAACDI